MITITQLFEFINQSFYSISDIIFVGAKELNHENSPRFTFYEKPVFTLFDILFCTVDDYIINELD
ncbi:MAG: hypothetical protein BWY70_01170 [Bacteroidetes bacterium ADurb.Bin408]|nr:MAG: hypothetical protein BWY70_01170 [Bacteroidetes bacterium ADurb.Bin408]